MTFPFATAPFDAFPSFRISFDVLADKRKNTICVQWFVVIATAYLLLLRQGQVAQEPLVYFLLALALASAIVIQRLPESTFNRPVFCQALMIAVKENPDLILLDLGLPAGDGFVVMERLVNLESLASVPVIVMSARDPQGHRDRTLGAGAKAYFQKPVDNDELLAAIRKVLGEAS